MLQGGRVQTITPSTLMAQGKRNFRKPASLAMSKEGTLAACAMQEARCQKSVSIEQVSRKSGGQNHENRRLFDRIRAHKIKLADWAQSVQLGICLLHPCGPGSTNRGECMHQRGTGGQALPNKTAVGRRTSYDLDFDRLLQCIRIAEVAALWDSRKVALEN